jgi:hypothetical protein
MSDAKKCNRCSELVEPKAGDLVILDLHEHMKDKGVERAIYTESENECDLCSPCSRELRAFLKPIDRPRHD